MPKWEYLSISFAWQERQNNWGWYAESVNGQTAQVEEDLHRYLEKLGTEGWELVSEREVCDGYEYITKVFRANAETPEAVSYLKKTYPDWKTPPKFSPEAMEWILNTWGDSTWELVHLQPVDGEGRNGDIYYHGNTGSWTNAFFGAFKRRKYRITMRFKRPKD